MIRLCQKCEISLDYLVRGIETGNTEDVPTYVIEMYRNADSLELTILQDHMQSAQREISRKQNLERQYKNGQDVS